MDSDGSGGSEAATPLEGLGLLAMETVAVDDTMDHLELYTSSGLLTLLWHGAADAADVVVCVGGAMGGLLGPDGGLYHQLGRQLPDLGIGVIRLSYRRPNDLSECVHDTLSAMELAARHGARRFIVLGHSFGGAVAIQAAAHLDADSVPGVVTFATQSAGCEPVESLGDRDLLFCHGTADPILPHQSSQMVQMLAENGEVWLLDDANHLLHPAGPELLERMVVHLPAVFQQAQARFAQDGTNRTS